MSRLHLPSPFPRPVFVPPPSRLALVGGAACVVVLVSLLVVGLALGGRS